jgi:hypothetical protein
MTSINFENNEISFNDSKSMQQLNKVTKSSSKTGSRNRSQSVSSLSCKDQFDLSLSSIEQASSISSNHSGSLLNKTQEAINKLADKIQFSNNCDSTSILTKRKADLSIDNSFTQSNQKLNELHISTDESSNSQSSHLNKRNKKIGTKAFDLKDLI